MKRAVITVGLGFGDEGKGATVDYLTRELDADLVVRYCGGSQAGHNVELPDGKRHTFAQFGAGTLAPNRPKTYLGPAMVVDPPALLREARHLTELGVADPLQLITIHPRCLVTTPWLKLLNRVRELARGGSRHGSCGQGIGEARSYWLRHGEDAIFAADLHSTNTLRHKLELQRQRILLEIQPQLELESNLTPQPPSLERKGEQDCNPSPFGGGVGEGLLSAWELSAVDAVEELAGPAWQDIATTAEVPAHRMAILEGAQGVLLDEYRGFHPHTTWSTVTPHHAWEMVAEMGSEAVTLLGITRAFTTRHGDGPHPTYSAELTARLTDPGNPWNAWQGTMRCGWLDLVMLRYAVAVSGPLDGLVVNHLDQAEGGEFQICEAYRNASLHAATVPNLAWQSRLTEQVQRAEPLLTAMTPTEMLRVLETITPVVVTGFGPTHLKRKCSNLTFRKKRN
ncbi:MAG: adenylosuccinate synthetase [Planctomycetes bacterium]|nr:adenylosuccinate synthetase [Planctomycetota bacterium]